MTIESLQGQFVITSANNKHTYPISKVRVSLYGGRLRISYYGRDIVQVTNKDLVTNIVSTSLQDLSTKLTSIIQ